MSDQRGQRGFTLVEMIIAMTIFAFLFTVISYIQARGAPSGNVPLDKWDILMKAT